MSSSDREGWRNEQVAARERREVGRSRGGTILGRNGLDSGKLEKMRLALDGDGSASTMSILRSLDLILKAIGRRLWTSSQPL